MDKVYEEYKSEILYTWYTVLREETLEILEMINFPITRPKGSSLMKKDPRAVFDPCKEPMLQHLLDYNRDEMNRIFVSTSLPCPICLVERMGSDCLKLNCDHAFCIRCVAEYWTGLITEGQVDGVKCLSYECTGIPTPEQVLKYELNLW